MPPLSYFLDWVSHRIHMEPMFVREMSTGKAFLDNLRPLIWPNFLVRLLDSVGVRLTSSNLNRFQNMVCWCSLCFCLMFDATRSCQLLSSKWSSVCVYKSWSISCLYAYYIYIYYTIYIYIILYMVTDRIMEKKTFNLDRRRLRPIFP